MFVLFCVCAEIGPGRRVSVSPRRAKRYHRTVMNLNLPGLGLGPETACHFPLRVPMPWQPEPPAFGIGGKSVYSTTVTTSELSISHGLLPCTLSNLKVESTGTLSPCRRRGFAAQPGPDPSPGPKPGLGLELACGSWRIMTRRRLSNCC